MTSGRRRAVLALLLITLAGGLAACGRFGGNDTNPRSDEKRDSAPVLGTPAARSAAPN
jgi:hypothetical protein